MDFKTLSEKLARGGYKTMQAFAHDVTLIFDNCRQFNYPGTDPSIAADEVEQVFKREWATIMRGRLTVAEKKHLVTFLEKMRNVPEYAYISPRFSLQILTTIFASVMSGS